jgi:LysR family transcriptional regulator, glycine cleavage system transcriptional activator
VHVKIPTSELPSLETLRCFVAAAETLNFRAAATMVGLTPAALGQRVKQLEDSLGVVLFRRTTRTVSLTRAGLDLLPYAQQTLEAASSCARAARGELGPAPIELVLGTRHELGMSWLLPQMEALQKTHAHVTFHMYFGSGEDLLLRIRTREIDCAVTSTRVEDPRLDSVRLHEEEYVFVGASKALKKVPLKKREHAKDHTLFDTRASLPLYGYWRNAEGGSDLHFKHIVRMGTIAALEHFVSNGDGVGVLPRYLVAAKIKRGTLTEIFPSVRPLSDYFRLVFRVDDTRRSLYESLATMLLKTPLR